MNIMGIKIQFETRYPSNKELRSCPKLNLTEKNEWNPSSVSLVSADSTRDQIKEPGFKEQLLATIPRTISKTSQTYSSTDRHSKISAEVLADRFGIGIDRANTTLKATLQRGTRSAILPIIRRYRSDIQYGFKRLKGGVLQTPYVERASPYESTPLHKYIAINVGSLLYTTWTRRTMKTLGIA